MLLRIKSYYYEIKWMWWYEKWGYNIWDEIVYLESERLFYDSYNYLIIFFINRTTVGGCFMTLNPILQDIVLFKTYIGDDIMTWQIRFLKV
jgi:hypothetical protein